MATDIIMSQAAVASPLSSLISPLIQGLGSWTIGTFIGAILEGALLQQTVQYFRLYSQDPLYLKAWVIIVVVLQTISTAFTMHTSYFYTILNYGNPLVVLKGAVITAKLQPIIGPIGELLVEMFFVRRVILVGRQYRIFAVLPVLLILASTAFYFALSAQAFMINDLDKSLNFGGWLATTGSSLMLAADVQLTTVLIYALHTSRTGITRTNSMIDILIMYTISSGFLICLFNICAIALSAALPTSVIFTTFLIIGQQIYSLSFVTALNTRRFVAERGGADSLGVSEIKAKRRSRKQASGTAVGEVELASMAFAVGQSETQLGGDSEVKATQTFPEGSGFR